MGNGRAAREHGSLLRKGTVIAGRYRIGAPIGHGEMADVYRAQQPALGRHVAVKVMREGSPRDTRRFTIEAETLGRLRHPNAVVAHDYGIYEDEEGHGRPFIVMQLVEGETLAARLEREGALDPAVVRHIALSVASCVGAAHGLGIVHRDLKPTNIMLTDGSDPNRPDVHVLDFGLAKLFAPRVSLTDDGELVGTPRYMAPEQFDEDATIGPPVDVWALGLLIEEMATGRHPLGEKTAFSEVLGWVRSGPMEVSPRLPADLARVVRACRQREPSERLQSMAAVRAELGGAPDRRWLGLALLLSLLVVAVLTLWALSE